MPLRFRMRGAGMTARPEVSFESRPLSEVFRHLAATATFEGWVRKAENWARDALSNAGHSLQDQDIKSLKQIELDFRKAGRDSDEEFAARILGLILRVRDAIADGNAERAAMYGVRLGEAITLHDLKQEREPVWDSGRRHRRGAKKGGEAKRGVNDGRDRKLALLFIERRAKSKNISDTALKADIGAKEHGLKRSASIAAVDHGLKLSGERGKPDK